jgi:hypothetical protein
MRFSRKVKKRSNWSCRFAWIPTKAELYQSDGRPDKYVWVWLERYTRYFNYGAPVNYVN